MESLDGELLILSPAIYTSGSPEKCADCHAWCTRTGAVRRNAGAAPVSRMA
jgi:hypothetical protein